MKLTDEMRRLAAEMDELWAKLEPKLQKFNQDATKFGNELGDDLNTELNRAGSDLKAGLAKLRDKLR